MAAPADEQLRELSRLLVIASETGDARSFPSLQEELGVGHDDLAGMLDRLREHGQAIEAAPGEWRGPMADELPREQEPEAEPESPRVRVDAPADDLPEPGRGFLSEAVTFGATVRLTPGVAAALDAPALGAIVKAGIDEAKEAGVPFILEVLG